MDKERGEERKEEEEEEEDERRRVLKAGNNNVRSIHSECNANAYGTI